MCASRTLIKMLALLAWLRLAYGQASRKKRIDEFAPLTLKSIALRALVHARLRSRPIHLAALRHALGDQNSDLIWRCAMLTQHNVVPLNSVTTNSALCIGKYTPCVMLTQHNVVPLNHLGRWAKRCSLTYATVAPLFNVVPAVPLGHITVLFDGHKSLGVALEDSGRAKALTLAPSRRLECSLCSRLGFASSVRFAQCHAHCVRIALVPRA